MPNINSTLGAYAVILGAALAGRGAPTDQQEGDSMATPNMPPGLPLKNQTAAIERPNKIVQILSPNGV